MIEILKYLLENYPIPSFIGSSIVIIALILGIFQFAKKTEIAKALFSIYELIIDKEIKSLEKKINSNDYSESEKIIFYYRKKVLKYQRDLKTNETHLPLLIYLSSFENVQYAIKAFHNSREFLKFNDEKFTLEISNELNESTAKARAKLGERVFGFNGILAYFIAMCPIWFFPEYISKTSVIPIFLVLIILIFGQIYLGSLFMRYMAKHKNALELPKMNRINPNFEKDLEASMNKIVEVTTASNLTEQLLLPNSAPSTALPSVDIAANVPIVNRAFDRVDEKKENKTQENITAGTKTSV